MSPTVSPTSSVPMPTTTIAASAGERLFGPSKSGLPWHSGAWTAPKWTAAEADGFATWRGTALDSLTTYPERHTWEKIAASEWHINTWAGFDGRLSYGLPMLPDTGEGSFETIAAGQHDWVWDKIANDLVKYGRDDAIIRIGWEANGTWWKWSATADTAESYKAAFRHIAGRLKAVSPKFVIDFDIACGTAMPGQSDRVDSLTKLYPGDDVVDLIGCDFYDWWNTKSVDEASWQSSIRPWGAPGIADVADFARQRGRAASIPEWGVAKVGTGGAGDNPFFIRKMYEWFQANKDVVAFESYFNENDDYILSGLWDTTNNPLAGAEYIRLW